MSQEQLVALGRQTGKETLRRVLLDVMGDGPATGRRYNLVLFCIRAHLAKVDQRPDWQRLWLKEILLARQWEANQQFYRQSAEDEATFFGDTKKNSK